MTFDERMEIMEQAINELKREIAKLEAHYEIQAEEI